MEEKKPIEVVKVAPYQLCPKCNGSGIVSKPPHLAGDINNWFGSSSVSFQCNVCNGAKIIPMFVVEEVKTGSI